MSHVLEFVSLVGHPRVPESLCSGVSHVKTSFIFLGRSSQIKICWPWGCPSVLALLYHVKPPFIFEFLNNHILLGRSTQMKICWPLGCLHAPVPYIVSCKKMIFLNTHFRLDRLTQIKICWL